MINGSSWARGADQPWPAAPSLPVEPVKGHLLNRTFWQNGLFTKLLGSLSAWCPLQEEKNTLKPPAVSKAHWFLQPWPADCSWGLGLLGANELPVSFYATFQELTSFHFLIFIQKNSKCQIWWDCKAFSEHLLGWKRRRSLAAEVFGSKRFWLTSFLFFLSSHWNNLPTLFLRRAEQRLCQLGSAHFMVPNVKRLFGKKRLFTRN